MKYEAKNLSSLLNIANEILDAHKSPSTFLLSGDMGVGKTTFVKTICNVLGADFTGSPTFSLVNEYSYGNGKKIFHLDLYRVKDIQEALDFGVEEYLSKDAYVFIEWPEKIIGMLDKAIAVKITEAEGVRYFDTESFEQSNSHLS